jgi:hypothetical protein
VVGVPVPEDDLPQRTTKPADRRPKLLEHAAPSRVELHQPVPVFDQVDVHAAGLPLHPPDALGDQLWAEAAARQERAQETVHHATP